MRIRWQDRVSNQEVLERASNTSIEAMIIKAQLRWTGHVIRMDESRISHHLFYGELTEGKRNPGRHKKRYKDNLKANLKWAGIEPKELETAASNRSGWRATTMSATRNFENNRRLCIAAARDRRKRAANNQITTGGTPCPIFNRMCTLKVWSSKPHACTPLTLITNLSPKSQPMDPNHQFILCYVSVILAFKRQHPKNTYSVHQSRQLPNLIPSGWPLYTHTGLHLLLWCDQGLTCYPLI